VSLRKFIAIKNVGRFSNCNASGDVTLKRYNLIFAENGRGKSTLCDILRSLQNGDGALIIGRRTLGSPSAPEVSILTATGTIAFANGNWNTTLPSLLIFDSTFISQNVYSGDAVGLDHRRNLYRVIIGKGGVDLARAVDELDADIRSKTSEIRDRRSYVQSMAPAGVSVEEFSSLSADLDIDSKIDAKQRELEAVRQATQLNSRAGLTPIALPILPENLESLLGTTLEGLTAATTQRVNVQIAAHGMHTRGEAWLAEGLVYVRDQLCPFCEQAIAGSELVSAYNTYFSAAYRSLKQQIADVRAQIDNLFGERAIAQIERSIQGNDATTEFWTRYCEIARPSLPSDTPVGELLRSLSQEARRLLMRKAEAPLDPVANDQAFSAASSAVTAVREAVGTYNAAVAAANTAIAEKKSASGSVSQSAVESSLRNLQSIKARHQTATNAACSAHIKAIEEKTVLEAQKEAARQKLDEHTQQVIGRYEKTINDLLDDFQAGFRITGIKHAYPGGVPSSSFQILINETAVDVGDANTPAHMPSFRNTLSAGDKSTLALAFFLAQLAHDPEKISRIVVFDDPFSSQDAFRKDHTVEKIRKCGEGCTQIIVLSHDQSFLKRVWERLTPQSSERRCLQLARIGIRDTAIHEWDIEKATQQRFKADLKALADFYNTGQGDPRDIVGKLRPVLETYSRNLYPSQFPEADMLAAIITKIRQEGPTHGLASVVEDMDTINVYTRRYHHGESPNPATEVINDTELQGFVKKTLTIAGFS
jgi:wobble nucleotide-excising tRNase